GNPPSPQATRDRNAVSFSSDSPQPQRWLSAPVRSRNRLWVKVSSVRWPAGLKSSATVVSCSRGAARSAVSCHAQATASTRDGAISAHLPENPPRGPPPPASKRHDPPTPKSNSHHQHIHPSRP